MKELSRAEIESEIEILWTKEKFQKLFNEILDPNNKDIRGLAISTELSKILDSAVKRVLELMGLPNEVTVVAVGSDGCLWRASGSDADYVLYVPDTVGYEWEFTKIYKQNMRVLYDVLGLTGDPTVWVAGDFRTDDLLNISSMNIDSRLIYGWDILTLEEIKKKVESVCTPILMAVKHAEILDNKFSYWKSLRDVEHVDLDIKKDRWVLRHIQHVLWFIATIENSNRHDLVQKMKHENPEVYNALDLLLHIRSWLHLNIENNDTKIDLLRRCHRQKLEDHFWADIFERIQNARSAIISFERTKILEKKQAGMKIWDGTIITQEGFDIESEPWGDNKSNTIQVILNAQITGLQISPSFYNQLETGKHNPLGIWTHPKLATLLLEEGKFSATLRRLIRFGIIENLIPEFSTIQNQIFHKTHLHSDLTLCGRMREELENLERIVYGDFKDLYANLSQEERAGIRLAIVCKDIPNFSKKIKENYFHWFKSLYPTLNTSIDLAHKLIKMQNALFDCPFYEGNNDPTEFTRIAQEIDSRSHLDALLIYTCALRDYGTSSRYAKYAWDKVFSFYTSINKSLESRDPEKKREHEKIMVDKMLRLSPQQQEIFRKAPSSFHYSRYIFRNEDLMKTMRYLWKVDEEWKPQITISRSVDNTVKIIVSAKYSDKLLPIILGICHNHNIDIWDAETYRFDTEDPLSVIFLEINTGNQWTLSSWKITNTEKFEKELNSALNLLNYDWPDARDILAESHPNFILEKTKTSDKYKLIVTAEKNTPWFLYAIIQILAEIPVVINSTSVYTHLRNDSWPLIEDIFILEPHNIEKLQASLGIRITE